MSFDASMSFSEINFQLFQATVFFYRCVFKVWLAHLYYLQNSICLELMIDVCADCVSWNKYMRSDVVIEVVVLSVYVMQIDSI